MLSEHFAEGVRALRKGNPKLPVKVINFDWHGMMKQLGEKESVQALWSLLANVIPESGIAAGYMEPNAAQSDSR